MSGADTHEGAPTVLIVDDDDELRETMTFVLEDQGWRVVGARSGEEALALVRSKRFDAMVTDQRMPGMTGEELVKQLRAAACTVPTVLITAAANIKSLADSLGLPCYLGKPFGVDDLIAVVQRAADGQC